MLLINCKGRLLDLSTPQIMGILNITPDSFYRGYLHNDLKSIIEIAGKMFKDGASIIDIGGQSTRPGSIRLNAETEAERVIPVLEVLHEHFPERFFSIDTYHSEVALKALSKGACLINDISFGDMDPDMIAVAADSGVPYVGMHMQGVPESMQNAPSYNDVTKEVMEYFIRKTEICKNAGIKDIILDPGFGFGKTDPHNFQLLKELKLLTALDFPLLAGLSRKGMICRAIGCNPENALNGTTAAHILALMNGASILRVHDVKEASEAVRIFCTYKNAAP